MRPSILVSGTLFQCTSTRATNSGETKPSYTHYIHTLINRWYIDRWPWSTRSMISGVSTTSRDYLRRWRNNVRGSKYRGQTRSISQLVGSMDRRSDSLPTKRKRERERESRQNPTRIRRGLNSWYDDRTSPSGRSNVVDYRRLSTATH